jgi:hypothetical protein
MIEKYSGKVIAVEQRKDVTIETSRAEVCRPFREAGQEIMSLVIEVPHPEQFENLWI